MIHQEPDGRALPALYILMRNDLASMNAGKAMAQAAHAANQFIATPANPRYATSHETALESWVGEGGTFGTTLVLSVDEREMRKAVADARSEGFHAGITHDSTYPIRDGKVTHLIPLDTCAFIFTPCRRQMPLGFLKGYPLHP